MEISKSSFFTSNAITLNDIINLMPVKVQFTLFGENFYYSFPDSKFKTCWIETISPTITDYLTNNNISYVTKTKNGRYRDTYKLIIKCDSYKDFIQNNNISDYEIVYESEEFLKGTPYIHNFFINNISNMNGKDNSEYYCTIRLRTSKYDSEEDENIDISFSGNSIIISGRINQDNELVKMIKDITVSNFMREEMVVGKYFHLSNNCSIPVDHNKINDLFNCTLDYFPDLFIRYIYIGYNYYHN